ncbi:MAG: hypothetical protein A3C53_07150 [Omnitrophica WOR_2 bacterium RIFCSPHIGHO2_02_FULL_68_15]|nr:MAG: hypothetical protein A3C53_07150 [Omnitrophica WOR_2 bacterium RIFCSPHIGHO2_02_FULL_68_15]
MPWYHIPTAILIAALAVPPVGWAAPSEVSSALRVQQLEPSASAPADAQAVGLEEGPKRWWQRGLELLDALRGRATSSASPDPLMIQVGDESSFQLFDPNGPPFKLLVAGWVEFQRRQGVQGITPADGPYLLSIQGALAETQGRSDNSSTVDWLMRVSGRPKWPRASAQSLVQHLEPLIRAAVRDPEQLEGLRTAVQAVGEASRATRGARYVNLIRPVQDALTALARPQSGLEEGPPDALQAANAFWQSILSEARLESVTVFGPALVAKYPALQALPVLAPERFMVVLDPSPESLEALADRLKGLPERPRSVRLCQFALSDIGAMRWWLPSGWQIESWRYHDPNLQGFKLDPFLQEALHRASSVRHWRLPLKAHPHLAPQLEILWAPPQPAGPSVTVDADHLFTMPSAPDQSAWFPLESGTAFLRAWQEAGHSPIVVLHRHLEIQTTTVALADPAATPLAVRSSSNALTEPVTEGFWVLDTDGHLHLYDLTSASTEGRETFETVRAGMLPAEIQTSDAPLVETAPGLEEAGRAVADDLPTPAPTPLYRDPQAPWQA